VRISEMVRFFLLKNAMTIKEKSVVRLGKTNQGEKFGHLLASMFTDLL
jgi:hypothetical protein